MVRSGLVLAGVLSTALSLGLAGCGDDSADGGKGKGAVTSPAASPGNAGQPAQAGAQVGGAKSGVTLTLPAGWKQLDPTQDASEVVQTSFSLNVDMGELVKQLMTQQIKQGVLFAIDTSVTSGYAPHLSAGCDKGGAVGASLEQLRRKQQAMEPNSQITDVTVGGKPGFKATYSSTKKSGPVAGVTVRVSLSADRFCFVDIEAKQGAMPPTAEQIASSFKLA